MASGGAAGVLVRAREQARAAWARAGGREVADRAGKLGRRVRKGGGGGLG